MNIKQNDEKKEATMRIFAHRGVSAEAPENSLAAIALAWERGADGIEVDVRLTADGEVVLLHDPSTGRTAAGPDLRVEDVAFDALKALELLPAGSGLRIPTLLEALDLVPAGRQVILDLKGPGTMLPALERVVRDWPGNEVERVHFVGADAAVLEKTKARFPAHAVFWNRSRRWNEGRPSWAATVDRWIERARERGLDGLGLDVEARIDRETVERIHGAAMRIFAWTVNDRFEIGRLRELGIDYLATDQPGDA